MSQRAAQLRHWRRRERQKAKKRNEPSLTIKNFYGVVDMTPYIAVRLLRGGPDKTIMNSTSLVKLSR